MKLSDEDKKFIVTVLNGLDLMIALDDFQERSKPICNVNFHIADTGIKEAGIGTYRINILKSKTSSKVHVILEYENIQGDKKMGVYSRKIDGTTTRKGNSNNHKIKDALDHSLRQSVDEWIDIEVDPHFDLAF